MNSPSKSFPTRQLRHFSSRSAPAVLDTVEEDDKEKKKDVPGPSSSTHKMTESKKQPSRLHRLAQFLPKLNTNSKLQKDTSERPSILQKPLPITHELLASVPPPSRSAPQVPILDHPPDSHANHHKNKLQKHAAIAQEKVLPRIPPPIPAGLPVEPIRRPRGNSLVPPNTQSEYGTGRSVSTPLSFAGLDSYHSEGEGGGSSKVRKSWLGRKSRNTSQDLNHATAQAWVNAGAAKIEYNTQLLLGGEKVPELWNDAADTFVYLFPQETGRGPQFRVPSTVLSSSQLLLYLLQADSPTSRSRGKSFDGRASLTIEDATRNLYARGVGTPPYTPKTIVSTVDNQSVSDSSGESIKSFTDSPRHLYFPTGLLSVGPQFSPEDTQRLVEVRNLFALLTGQPLIATRTCPTNFGIFLAVAALLRRFEFSSEDGSSFGSAVDLAFSFCLKDMVQLADCRESREATLEALVLGEAMKSTELYNEAFAHAVGKYDDIRCMRSPIFDLVSPLTRNRLEKASMDLKTQQRSANDRLTDFEFPSIFAGIATSTTSAESKVVRFKAWKSNFMAIRKHVMSYYKDLHGQWPPKANSKKNNFVEGGLNRLVLKGLYSDLCDLYDFLADRTALTTRVYNEDGEDASHICPVASALRKLLDEYDRSSPPVQPPIPFDIPLLPTVKSLEAGFHMLSPKDQHKHLNRKLKDYETQLVLSKSHNLDADYKSTFIEAYKAFELKEARGKNSTELSEQRHGYWIFLYACLQSLPLLTTDAPDLQYTDGVEYFLCAVPFGNLPWLEDQSQVKMAWFGVQGGQQIVSLPSDVVNHGVEATYRRSHCWTIAQRWIGADHANVAPVEDMEILSPLSPPPGFAGGELGLRPSVRNRQRSSSTTSQRTSNERLSPGPQNGRSRSRQSQRKSIALGLERLPLDTSGVHWSPVSFQPSSRGTSPVGYPSARGNTAGLSTPSERKGSTFDDILGSMEQNTEKRKGKK